MAYAATIRPRWTRERALAALAAIVVQALLGYAPRAALVHRDDMAVNR